MSRNAVAHQILSGEAEKISIKYHSVEESSQSTLVLCAVIYSQPRAAAFGTLWCFIDIFSQPLPETYSPVNALSSDTHSILGFWVALMGFYDSYFPVLLARGDWRGSLTSTESAIDSTGWPSGDIHSSGTNFIHRQKMGRSRLQVFHPNLSGNQRTIQYHSPRVSYYRKNKYYKPHKSYSTISSLLWQNKSNRKL